MLNDVQSSIKDVEKEIELATLSTTGQTKVINVIAILNTSP